MSEQILNLDTLINFNALHAAFGKSDEKKEHLYPPIKAATKTAILFLEYNANVEEYTFREKIINHLKAVTDKNGHASEHIIRMAFGINEKQTNNILYGTREDSVQSTFFGGLAAYTYEVNEGVYDKKFRNNLGDIVSIIKSDKILGEGYNLDNDFNALRNKEHDLFNLKVLFTNLLFASEVKDFKPGSARDGREKVVMISRDGEEQELDKKAFSNVFNKDTILTQLEKLGDNYANITFELDKLKNYKLVTKSLEHGFNDIKKVSQALCATINGQVIIFDKDAQNIYGDNFPNLHQIKLAIKSTLSDTNSPLTPKGEGISAVDQMKKIVEVVNYEHSQFKIDTNNHYVQPLKDVLDVLIKIKENKGLLGSYLGSSISSDTIRIEINGQQRDIKFDIDAIADSFKQAREAATRYGDNKILSDFDSLSKSLSRDLMLSKTLITEKLQFHDCAEVDEELKTIYKVSKQANKDGASYNITIDKDLFKKLLQQEEGYQNLRDKKIFDPLLIKKYNEISTALKSSPYTDNSSIIKLNDSVIISNPPAYLENVLTELSGPQKGIPEALEALNAKVNGGFKFNTENPKQKADGTYDILLLNPKPVSASEVKTFYNDLQIAITEKYPAVSAKMARQRDLKIENAPNELLEELRTALSKGVPSQSIGA